jgi:lipopolysaccharide/colanic/teichoic acid biosynthesis glycosyltransferase
MMARLLTLKEYAINAHGKAISSKSGDSPFFSEDLFAKLLSLERKRAERSRKPFALMLVDAGKLLRTNRRDIVCARIAVALSLSTRETDVWGWHKEGVVIGVILTEIGSVNAGALRDAMLPKVTAALGAKLGPEEVGQIRVAFHVFPEDPGSQNGNNTPVDATLHLYPDLQRENIGKKSTRLIKRGMDVAGSLSALFLLWPVFLAIAIAIKLTSKGPVFFKQERIGQYGVTFTFLKFRSMYHRSDSKIHQEYVRRLIAGKDDCRQPNGNGDAYKLQNDPRITPVGAFLRRTSLDELPQFFNVLRGDMSLVGPRPHSP